MELDKAQKSFQQIYDDLKPEQKEEFLQWIFETRGQSAFECLADRMQAAEMKMSEIINDLKNVLPFSGLLESEKIYFPKNGEHSDCDPKHTVNVDAFLYDDWTLDQLCEEGKLQRSYCKECGSHETAPLTFISHSMSKRRLQYLFLTLLSDLKGKTVVDIGSRLGTVLYGAYVYSAASKIIGIEMNAELCQLQQQMVDKHSLGDRIQVICGDVCSHADVIKQADVVVIHSVIDFFLPEDRHSDFWKFIYENTRQKGKVLVTTPSLQRAIGHLKIGLDISSWVKPVAIPEPAQFEAAHDPDLAELQIYECL